MSSPQPSESDHWNGPSDHEVEGSDRENEDFDHEDDDSDSSSSEAPHAFIDVEASEADSDEQQSADRSIISEDDNDDDLSSFPQFMHLPAELREMIWKAFCPDLTGRPRVFEVIVQAHEDGPASLIHRTPDQTILNRAVLAVHRESRELALKTSPSQILFKDEQCPIPCDYRKDVLLLNIPPGESANDNALVLIDDCLSQFHNVALTMGTVEEPSFFPSLLGLFDDLRNVFIVEHPIEQSSKGLAWCVSGKTHEYTFTFEEDMQDWPEPIEITYIWPDVTKHRDAAHREFPTLDSYTQDFDDSDEEGVDHTAEKQRDDNREPVAFDYMQDTWVYEIIRYRRMMAAHFNARIDAPEDEDDEEEEEQEENGGLRLGVWPMAMFMFKSSQEQLADLKARQGPWIDWSSSSEMSDVESPPNEYESEGIDDDEIGDLSTDDDDDGDLIDEGDDQDNSDVDTSDLDGMLVGSSGFGDLHAAQFSSDSEVGSSQSHGGGSSHGRTSGAAPRIIELDSEDESSDEAIQPGPSGPSRHRPHVVVIDSEDENSEVAEGPLEPARGVKRRARAMLIESDEEEDQENESPGPSRAAKRRARPALSSDSEDEDEVTGTGKTTSDARKVPDDSPSRDEEEEGESSSDNDDDDEPPPPKRISLAKRLQLEYRSNRAVRPTDDSDDEGADGQSYGGASDDDEGDEDESEGGAMVMGMAEEGDEEEEQEEDLNGW